MTYRPKGKHVCVDEMNPKALGICDKTGFVHLRKDLVRQMEWRGNALIWTGFLVGRTYADRPNPQLRPPILPPDPVPVIFPRPMVPNVLTWSVGSVGLWPNSEIYSWSSWSGALDGITCFPESVRLSLLQTNTIGSGLFGTGPAQAQYLPQNILLQDLEQTDWGPE